MRSLRGRERRLVRPGQLVAWDPSQPHAGRAVDGRPWASRLMVVEVADLAALADDPERDPLADVVFPQPVIADRALAVSFERLHAALDSSATRLERDERLAEWLREVIERCSAAAARPRAPVGSRRPSAATGVRLPRRALRAQRRPRRTRRGGRHREVPPHPVVPRAHRPAAPRAANRAPHPRRPPPPRSRRADRRYRLRDRLRRPEPYAPPLPAQPRAHAGPLPAALSALTPSHVSSAHNGQGFSVGRRGTCRHSA